MLSILLLGLLAAAIPFLALAFLGYRLLRPRKGRSAILSIVVACLLFLPYAYSQLQTAYRNGLCEQLGESRTSFDPKQWARLHPEEAAAITAADDALVPGEPGPEKLNSRFVLAREVSEHPFAVIQYHSSIIDAGSGTEVASSRTFEVPRSFAHALNPLRIRARGCSQPDSDFEQLVSKVRLLGYRNEVQ